MSKKSNSFKDDIVFRAIEWGFGKDKFSPQELFNGLNLRWEHRNQNTASPEEMWIYQNLRRASDQRNRYPNNSPESIFYALSPSGACNENSGEFSLTVDAKFKYIDFLELELARENSEKAQTNAASAQTHARKSIKIAFWALIITSIAAIPALIEIFEKLQPPCKYLISLLK